MVTLTPYTIRCWQMLKNLPPGLLTSVSASAATNHHITSHQDVQGDKRCCLSAHWPFTLQSTAGYQVWLAEISEERTTVTQFPERTKNPIPLQWVPLRRGEVNPRAGNFHSFNLWSAPFRGHRHDHPEQITSLENCYMIPRAQSLVTEATVAMPLPCL